MPAHAFTILGVPAYPPKTGVPAHPLSFGGFAGVPGQPQQQTRILHHVPGRASRNMGPAGPLGWTRQAPSSTLLLILQASTQLLAIAWQGCLGSATREEGEASPTTMR